jgi:hypothetical protein
VAVASRQGTVVEQAQGATVPTEHFFTSQNEPISS